MRLIDYDRMRLIHYGNDTYDSDRVKPIVDIAFRNKPEGGLWTSPVDSAWGWANWCDVEDFRTESLEAHFLLEYSGTTLVIDTRADMEELPWHQCPEFRSSSYISFQEIVEWGVDAIHLTERGQRETHLSYPRSLYGWDCETVFIMNKETICPLETSRVNSMSTDCAKR